MATKISTRLLSLKNARDYKQSISDGDIQYVYIGESKPYANDAVVPDIVESPLSMRDIGRSIIAAKKIEARDINLVVPRVDWTTNTNYYQYDDTISLTELLSSNTLNNTKPMYVFASNSRSVYLCLSNGSSNINGTIVRNDSTFEPDGDYDTSEGIIKKDDGYIWKYMYNILDGNEFIDTNFIPVPERSYTDITSNTAYGNFALKNSIVREGELATVIVTNQGSGYKDFTDVEFNTFTAGSTELVIKPSFLAAKGLTIDQVVSANMMIGVPGNADTFAAETFVSSVDLGTDTITLSKPTVGATPSTGVTVNTRIFFDTPLPDTNVTTRAEASPTVNATSGQIESVNVSTLGVGYTSFTNVRVFGTGTNATFRVVSAPYFGFCYDISKDLGANSAIARAKIGEIDSTENGKVATDISFREVGLMRRPYKYGTVRTNLVDANSDVLTGVTRLFVATGTDYENSELVYQGSANNNYTMIGYVHRTRDTVQVELTKVQGNITVGQALVGDNSGVSRIVTQIVRPDFEPDSVEILSTESTTPVTRADGQAEDVKVVLRF